MQRLYIACNVYSSRATSIHRMQRTHATSLPRIPKGPASNEMRAISLNFQTNDPHLKKVSRQDGQLSAINGQPFFGAASNTSCSTPSLYFSKFFMNKSAK